MSTPALILAAGAGSRFGVAPKQLADLDGRPVLAHVLEAVRAVPQVDRVVVVLGARADAVRAGVDLDGAHVVVCAGWEQGQSASLRAGLAALEAPEAALVLLGDQPLVTPAAIAAVLDAGPGARAVYGGAPGHPAFLDATLIARADGLCGDTGLRDAPWRPVEVGHLAPNLDLDTPEDLEAIRREARAVL